REGCWNVRIEFENGVFWVRDANKVRYNNKILNIPIASFQIETFEVIGNVWQNPELLEGVN
ncbi:MAG TPA: YopX family protein, partial [Acetivibrio sp.]|nr:YopX family protein [Acetivibrio sp.]